MVKDNAVSLKIPSQTSLTDFFCSSLGFGFIWVFFFLFFFPQDIFSINCDFTLQEETVASGKGAKGYLYFSSYVPGLQLHSVHQLKSVLNRHSGKCKS